jgi:iron complex outermembrane receptor protein
MIRYKRALAATMVAAIVTPAAAQETASGRNDIIVTARNFVVQDTSAATKSKTAILETPQAISVVDSNFINALNVRTVAEALNYSSGVRSQSFGSDTRIEYYQLRGFNSTNFFKDGLVLYNAGPFLSWTTPAEGVGRLEVLKGPASVLYGSSSAGGLVNIVSKAPSTIPMARLEGGIDEYGSVYGSADVGGPISDTLSLRAVGLVRRGDTQVKLAEDNRTYGALALSWAPLPDTILTLRASYTGDRSNRPTGFVPYAGFVRPLPDGRRIPIDLYVSDPSADRYDRDQYEAGYTLETRLSPSLRFVSNGRFGRINLAYAGLAGQTSGNPLLANGRYALARGNFRQDGWLDNVTLDNRLDLTFTTGPLSHDLLGGLDYSFSKTASIQRTGTAPPLDIFAPTYGVPIPAFSATKSTRQKLDQTGLYIQDRIKLGRFVALLSARHDWVSVTNATGLISRGDPAKTSYRAGLSYVTPVGLAPFVSFSTSFTPLIGAEAATGDFYRPETGRSWEAGLKFQPAAFPMIATASLFTIDRDGVLVANPVPGFPNNQSQLGRVRSRGGEIEVQARPLPTLNLTAALTIFDIDNRSGAAATIGKTPTATPEFTASAYADYSFPAGSALPGFGFGAGIRHVGKSYADAANTLVVPSATVFDGALHYDLARFRAAVNVSNLFDKRYVGACPTAGLCYAANLRRATFSLAYRFGETR